MIYIDVGEEYVYTVSVLVAVTVSAGLTIWFHEVKRYFHRWLV
jgi:hypothetical protein